jgi:hypothetical protein
LELPRAFLRLNFFVFCWGPAGVPRARRDLPFSRSFAVSAAGGISPSGLCATAAPFDPVGGGMRLRACAASFTPAATVGAPLRKRRRNRGLPASLRAPAVRVRRRPGLRTRVPRAHRARMGDIQIGFCNVRGWFSAELEVRAFLRRARVDILAIAEHHLSGGQGISIPGYQNSPVSSRARRGNGGVGFLVADRIAHLVVPEPCGGPRRMWLRLASPRGHTPTTSTSRVSRGHEMVWNGSLKSMPHFMSISMPRLFKFAGSRGCCGASPSRGVVM